MEYCCSQIISSQSDWTILQKTICKHFSLEMYKTSRDIYQETFSCNCSKRWFLKVLTNKGEYLYLASSKHCAFYVYQMVKKKDKFGQFQLQLATQGRDMYARYCTLHRLKHYLWIWMLLLSNDTKPLAAVRRDPAGGRSSISIGYQYLTSTPSLRRYVSTCTSSFTWTM